MYADIALIGKFVCSSIVVKLSKENTRLIDLIKSNLTKSYISLVSEFTRRYNSTKRPHLVDNVQQKNSQETQKLSMNKES